MDELMQSCLTKATIPIEKDDPAPCSYTCCAPNFSREVCLNGATAHLGKPGDLLVIMTFAEVTAAEAPTWKPRTATLAEGNRRIIRIENPEVPVELLTTFQR